MQKQQEREAHAEAHRLERCQDVVRRLDGTTIRFTNLSDKTKADCAIPQTPQELLTIHSHSATVEPESIQISLPTQTELQSQIDGIQPNPGEHDPLRYAAFFGIIGGSLAGLVWVSENS